MSAIRIRLGIAGVAIVAAAAVLQSGFAQLAGGPKTTASKPKTVSKTENDDDAKERERDENAIRASAAKFVKAFNAHDAKEVAAQFLKQAEYLNSDGEAFEGRDAIEKDLEQFFKEFPRSSITLEIDSIRFVGPKVAIEEGRTAVMHDPDSEPIVQSYVAVDLLVEGDWQLGSVRETAIEEPPTPHDRLMALEWLVGEWIDESDSGVAMTKCRWTEDGNYLLQDFELQVAGRTAVAGQQRIGWDPLTQHIKSWVFDSQGGYSEGLWTETEDQWIVKSHGVRPDGRVASATNSYTRRNQDSFSFESTSRFVGEESEADVVVIVVRRPPTPGSDDKDSSK